MERTDRFRTLDDVHLHRDRLRATRAHHLDGIKGHWGTLREREFRGAVVNSFFRDLWQTWRPLGALRTMAGNGSDLGGLGLGMLMGKRASSPWGRVATWIAGAVLPLVRERLGSDPRVQQFLSEVQRSWQRIKDHINERRAAN